VFLLSWSGTLRGASVRCSPRWAEEQDTCSSVPLRDRITPVLPWKAKARGTGWFADLHGGPRWGTMCQTQPQSKMARNERF
jgi:hypothetical protein